MSNCRLQAPYFHFRQLVLILYFWEFHSHLSLYSEYNRYLNSDSKSLSTTLRMVFVIYEKPQQHIKIRWSIWIIILIIGNVSNNFVKIWCFLGLTRYRLWVPIFVWILNIHTINWTPINDLMSQSPWFPYSFVYIIPMSRLQSYYYYHIQTHCISSFIVTKLFANFLT